MAKNEKAKPQEITEESLGVSQETNENVENTNVEEKVEPSKDEQALDGKVKQAPKAEKAPVSAQAELRSLEQQLDSFPKIRTSIPLGFGEKAGKAVETFGWNGVMKTYPKGIRIEVPEPIADIIDQSYGLKDAEEEYRLQGGGDQGVNLTGKI